MHRWDPKKRMTPDEAVRHEWLQPSGNASYNHSKSMRDGQENSVENQNMISPKTQQPAAKYQRSQHQTPSSNTVLPDIKAVTATVASAASKYNQKTYKEKAKSKLNK